MLCIFLFLSCLLNGQILSLGVLPLSFYFCGVTTKNKISFYIFRWQQFCYRKLQWSVINISYKTNRSFIFFLNDFCSKLNRAKKLRAFEIFWFSKNAVRQTLFAKRKITPFFRKWKKAISIIVRNKFYKIKTVFQR